MDGVYLFILVMVTGSYYAQAPDEAPKINLLISEKPRSILLQWKNPPLDKINGIITGYKVNYRVKGESDWVSLDVLKSNNNHHSMVISGEDNAPLLPWRYYEVFVKLFNQKYNVSSKIEEVVVIGDGPGVAPAKFIATSVTQNSLILKWESIPPTYLPSQDSFQGYKVFYNEENGKQMGYNKDLIKDTNIKIKNLKHGTKYFFSIAAMANDVVGPVSGKLEVVTASGPLPPPVIDTHESRSPNTFYLKWKIDPSVSIVTRLLLHYKKKDSVDSWSTVELGSKKYITVKNLLPWQEYDVKIDLDSDGRKSTSSPTAVLVSGKVPGRAPSNVVIEDFKYTFIKVVWDEIDARWIHGAPLRYAVKYSLNEDVNTVVVNYTAYTNITLDNLQPDTAYRVQIAGKTDGGVGAYSDYKIGKTMKVKDPAVPQNVNAHNANPSKVKIRCSVMGDVSMFVVGLTDTMTGVYESVEYHMQTVQKVSNHEYSLVVTVKPFTRYKIQLKSCIIDKCSVYSTGMVIQTMEDIPTEVRDIRIVGDNVNDPVFTWKPPALVPGILRHYLLDIKFLDDISVDEYPIKIKNDTLTYTPRGLPPFSLLKLLLTAETVAPGPENVVSFKSPEGFPGAPTDILVILFRNYIMSIKWKKPKQTNGNIIGYKISYEGTKYYRPNFLTNNTIVVGANAVQPYRIPGLIPGTRYKVEISARTRKGYGEPGKAKNEIETRVKAPEAPKAPVLLEDISSTTITVYLQRAVQQYGPIKSYQLIVEEEESVGRKSLNTSINRRLSGDISDYSTAQAEGESSYIAAVIESGLVPGKFVVGNDKDYNHYRNHPLKPDTKYTLHMRGYTKDKERSYYGEASTLSLPRTLAVKKTWTTSPIPTATIIGVLAGVLFIIVLVVIVVRYKRAARNKETTPYEIGTFKGMAAAEEAEEMLPSPQAETLYPTNPDHPPLPVAQFPKHVIKLHRIENAGFKVEYPQLKIGKESPWDVAHLLENKPKNRYANIVAYDHSRVKLSRIHDIPGSDYINASYIDGYRKANAYVSTQGPLPSTYNDFWRMVWEVKSSSIVMLTNLQEKNKLKCHKYWPEDSTDYGDIKVTLLRSDSFADFTIRSFKLEEVGKQTFSSGGIYQVRQFHFTSWPDHGVPQYPTSLLNFRRKVRSFDSPNDGPTVVHCSAGVGRTGAYIAIDSMLQRVQHQLDVDIFNFIASMRMRRIAMVQTEDQYIFVHDTIVEAILNGNTEISVHELREAIRTMDQIDSVSKVSGFEMQWKTLNHSNLATHKNDVITGMLRENVNKNRYSTVLPTESSRVLLLPIGEMIESSTYINAVYVDSYKQKNAFILTQSPLPRTVFDFWRMVSEHGTTSIVMLNAVDEGDDYTKFWPDTGIREYDMVTVECIPDADLDECDLTANNFLKPVYRTPPSELVVRRLQITDKRNPTRSFTARLFHYTGWTETRVPNTYRPVISLLSQIERWQQQSGRGPITVMCSDGLGRSGTLAAIIYVLERVKLHQVFDCFQAIKAMRIQRPHVVKYMDQFKYVHYAVQEYLSAFEEHTKL